MYSWFIELLQSSLNFLYEIVGSYGMAIIIFTIIIRMLLYPLTAKQTRSMKRMQDLQPKMKEIKEKYDDDKKEQQEKMMELYKENNVNPLAGCLPLILQMAIIIPLFSALRGMEIEAGFLWIETLREPDTILVFLNAVAIFGQSYITQKNRAGKAGGMMMWIMPVFILFIGFQMPAGVLIYFITSTLIHAIQHYKLGKESEQLEEENTEPSPENTD